MLLSIFQVHENHVSDVDTFLKGINEFLPVVSYCLTDLHEIWQMILHVVPLNIYECCENHCTDRHALLMGLNEFLIWPKFGIRDFHITLFSI